MKHPIRRISVLAVVALAAAVQSACIEDEDFFQPERTPTAAFMRRYVALGNSLTAGYMSGGINDSTQQLAYPVLLAERARVGFVVPSLAMPGCPPPLLGVLDRDASGELARDSAGRVVLEADRVGGGTSSSCALRISRSEPVQNVAVPGAKIADAVDLDRPGNATNTLTTLLIGGVPQVEAMALANPTFISVWLGNNDVLSGALTGDTTRMTPVDTFAYYLERVSNAIGAQQPGGVAFIGVLEVTVAPVLQPGLYYWVADSLGLSPKPVSDDCAPVDSLGAINPLASNTVSFLAYRDDDIDVISCDPAAEYVLTAAERLAVAERVQAYNSLIQGQTQERDWVLVNAQAALEDELLTSSRFNRLRTCEDLEAGLPFDELVDIFEAQCPHPDAPNFFGSFVTYDGIHMSGAAHEILADEMARVLNSHYTLTL
ncbi:MAG TPA: SGNH/GDSL hydrolase family protein [Longimicrobiales bacterium]